MSIPLVLISLSAFGADEVRRDGQRRYAELALEAGADGFEVRGELLSNPAAELPALASLAQTRGAARVYSSPEGLWHMDGTLALEALERALQHTALLGAPRLKMSIGGYAGPEGLTLLTRRLAETRVELLIENDQTESAGTLPALRRFFADAQAAGLRLPMTFDMGNWHWQGEDPLQAAQAFSTGVGYVHCKGVQRLPAKWVAVPLMESAAPWRAVLRTLPAAVPRAIEYPLQGDDLVAVTRAEVALLRRLETQR
ncbi:sugar phosphate isomerase/epimerase family protein [Azohydromonas caseinilytica]|uniref:TIM barrel protein n=1 Tax=Azohydromonas caseinilytica TaxID=2728836 RepID=A0A848FA26_9BURK|nr:TIM barrel protein [Azohydromonas caseinilytica]NML15605.1 TIM barrel protein [Azohydromonas caseinilytica]